MSENQSTASGMHEIDVVSMATKGFRNVVNIMRQDLEALPEDAFTKEFGSKVRTVADIVHEVDLVNDHVGQAIRGEDQFEWPEGWIKAPSDMNTKARVLEAFEVSAEKFAKTTESYSAVELCEPLTTSEGVTTRLERIRFAILHMWYHSGQFNFIQTLCGDDAWHWS